MRAAQDQPNCVICEPGPGTPPLTWQGLGATFREDHKTVSAKKKKKKIWECTPQNPTSAVNGVAGSGFVSSALKNVASLHREPLLGLRFTASSLQDRLVPRRASQDQETGRPVHPGLSRDRRPVSLPLVSGAQHAAAPRCCRSCVNRPLNQAFVQQAEQRAGCSDHVCSGLAWSQVPFQVLCLSEFIEPSRMPWTWLWGLPRSAGRDQMQPGRTDRGRLSQSLTEAAELLESELLAAL